MITNYPINYLLEHAPYHLHHIIIHRGRIAALCSVCALSAEGQYPVASHAITLTGAAAEKSLCGFFLLLLLLVQREVKV